MRYFFGLLAFVAFIVLVVVIVTHHGSKSGTSLTGNKTVQLTDYIDKDSQVRFTIDGIINGEEDHRSIQISVSPTTRSIVVFRGYDQDVVKRQDLSNST